MKRSETKCKNEEFTPSELSILHLLISGFNTDRIAEELSMSTHEVIEGCSIMMNKGKAKNLKELVYIGLRNKVL